MWLQLFTVINNLKRCVTLGLTLTMFVIETELISLVYAVSEFKTLIHILILKTHLVP